MGYFKNKQIEELEKDRDKWDKLFHNLNEEYEREVEKLKQQLKEKNEKIKELEKEIEQARNFLKEPIRGQLKSFKKKNEEELNKLIVEHEKNIMKATIKAVMSVIDERIEELERSAVLMFDEDLTIDVADEVIRELQQLKKRLEKEV